MFNVDTPTAVSTLPLIGAAGTPGWFQNGNPAVGQDGTKPGQDWFNIVQGELLNLLAAAEITPSKSNLVQVLTAILSCQVMQDTGSVNALAVNPPVAIPALVSGMQLVVVPAHTNTDAITLNLSSLGAVPVVRPDGSPLQAGDIAKGQFTRVIYFNGGFVLALQPYTRQRLGEDITLYVSNGGSDSNNGYGPTTAFATLQAARVSAQTKFDLNAHKVFYSVAAGTYAPLICIGALLGQVDVTAEQLIGAGIGETIIDGTGADAVSVFGRAEIELSALSLGTSGSGSGLRVSRHSHAEVGNVGFNACATSHLQVDGPSSIYINDNYQINGGAPYHYSLSAGGYILAPSISGKTCTLSGTPAFSGAFAGASDCATLICGGMTFSGAATGSRYVVTDNASLDTNGAGSTFLPGDSGGAALRGGNYF